MTIEEAVRNAMCGKCIPYRKETKGKLNEILQENAELKRLLKLAVEDIAYFCEWEHKDEAMKLIGGNEEEN